MQTFHGVLWITAFDLAILYPLLKEGQFLQSINRLLFSEVVFPKRYLSVRAADPAYGEVSIFSEFPFSCSLLNDCSCHYLDFDLSPKCWFTKRPANCRNPAPWKKNEVQTESQAEAVRMARVLKYRPFGTIFFKAFMLFRGAIKRQWTL